MKLDDRRVPADFAQAVVRDAPIRIYSDGSPTRTFCYVADAVAGYFKVLLYPAFDVFNIGMDQPEISVRRLAEIYRQAGREIFGHEVEIEYARPEDKEYLTHNPSRRCPDLGKARSLLGFEPAIEPENGVRRFLQFLRGGGVAG